MMFNILLVDDEAMNYELLLHITTTLLHLPRNCDVQITYADTIADGLIQVDRGGWAVIISDINFSPAKHQPLSISDVKAGLEIVRRAAELRNKGNETPYIIVLTQYGKELEIEQEAMDCGADEFLGKDGSLQSLANILSRILKLPEEPAGCDQIQPRTRSLPIIDDTTYTHRLAFVWKRFSKTICPVMAVS